MKIYVPVLIAAVMLSGCAVQPEKPVMQDAQYESIALALTTGEACAIAGRMDMNLAAANSLMLEEQIDEFQYDPARMHAERQRTAFDVQQKGGVTQAACNVLTYEVLRTQAVRKTANDADLARKRMALQMLKIEQGRAAP